MKNYNDIKEKLISKGLNEDVIDEILIPIKKEFDRRICGIVWESQEEDKEIELLNSLPILENKSEISNDEDNPNHLLIEGDNLFSLTSLQYTHKGEKQYGQFDIIYIDPPYNLGNKDFKYNDSFVNKENQWKHSKWLSFMHKRLILAKQLLSEHGVIFISIDDTEFAHLKLLCDLEEVFGEKNYINTIFVLDNLKGKSNDNLITNVGHKVLVYARNKKSLEAIGGFDKIENIFGQTIEKKYKNSDNEGYYNEVGFRKSGQEKFRSDRGTMWYPILEKNGDLSPITDDEYSIIYDSKARVFDDVWLEQLRKKYVSLGYNFILPIDKDGDLLRWNSGFEGFKRLLEEGNIFYKASAKAIYEKKRPTPKEMVQHYADGVPKSYFYKSSYANGTNDLSKSLGVKKSDFSYPKPVSLIVDLMKMHPSKDAYVLDFFAGSGTTAESVMKLNKEDGGKRKFVLCTNNEVDFKTELHYLYEIGKLKDAPSINKNGEVSKETEKKYFEYIENNKEEYENITKTNEYQKLGICESITFKRVNNLINKNSSILGEEDKFTNNNLVYYKIETYIEESPIREITIKRVIDKFLNYIVIKEDSYKEVENNDEYNLFTDGKKMVLVYKKLNLTENQLRTKVKKILEPYKKYDKKAYSILSDHEERDGINYIPYPDDILNCIKNIKMEVKR